MRVLALATLICLLLLGTTWADQFKYIGTDKCKTCHKLEKYGNQYDSWAQSPHAMAYTMLADSAALAVGKSLGVDKPQENPKCLVCHTTGYDAPDSLKEASLTLQEGIGCESCHGAGSGYFKLSIMKDPKLSLANGLVIPDEKVCVKCHNEKSPTFKKFVFAEMVTKIEHAKKAMDKKAAEKTAE